MRRFGHFAVGVANGSAEIFSAFESGGAMWTGTGPRLESKHIKFDSAFAEPPEVHVSISMWDMDSDTNQRADIRAANVTPEGFDMQFRTWGDTRVARVRANWIAIGPVRYEDDWHTE